MEFMRSEGNVWIGHFISDSLNHIYEHVSSSIDKTSSSSSSGSSGGNIGDITAHSKADYIPQNCTESISLFNLSLSVRVLAAAANHAEYVMNSISFSAPNSNQLIGSGNQAYRPLLAPDGKLLFESLCELMTRADNTVAHATLSLLMRILKALPLSCGDVEIPKDNPTDSLEEQGKALLEMLGPTPGVNVKKDTKKNVPDPDPFLLEHSTRTFLRYLLESMDERNEKKQLEKEMTVVESSQNNIKNNENHESHAEYLPIAFDALSAFISESPDYFGKKEVETTDLRLESLERRKARLARLRLVKRRAKSHATSAVEEGELKCSARISKY